MRNKFPTWLKVSALTVLLLCLFLVGSGSVWNPLQGVVLKGAIVVPSDASAMVKTQASLLKVFYGDRVQICTGTGDQVKMLAAINTAGTYTTEWETNPGLADNVSSLGRYEVTWLPGTYSTNETLTIPVTADFTIYAQGSYVQYTPATGDAIVVQGALRDCLYFGTIQSASSGVALNFDTDNGARRVQFSKIQFNGLVGIGGNIGIGLQLGSLVNCNYFKGTDIYGFNTGVAVPGGPGGTNKTDTDVIEVNHIRRCNVCIEEANVGYADSITWRVNIDASLPNSIGIRTAGTTGQWYVTIGTWGTNSVPLILSPGAAGNRFTFNPPLSSQKAWQDNSGAKTGNITNTFVGNIGVRVTNSASQSIVDSTPTYLAFDTERWDTDGFHSNSVNNERLTCTIPGRYLITAQVTFASNATGIRDLLLELTQGGSNYSLADTISQGINGASTRISVSTIYDLIVGDYVKVAVFQDSGGALLSEKVVTYSPEFMMQKLD